MSKNLITGVEISAKVFINELQESSLYSEIKEIDQLRIDFQSQFDSLNNSINSLNSSIDSFTIKSQFQYNGDPVGSIVGIPVDFDRFGINTKIIMVDPDNQNTWLQEVVFFGVVDAIVNVDTLSSWDLAGKNTILYAESYQDPISAAVWYRLTPQSGTEQGQGINPIAFYTGDPIIDGKTKVFFFGAISFANLRSFYENYYLINPQ